MHRDIAARNVLLDRLLHCKIADFGLSRSLEEQASYHSPGTQLPVRWTAPEALEQQVFSEQTDVWSFGILLDEIWNKGAMPYGDMTELRVWVEVVGGYRLPCPENCPQLVFAVMNECWVANGSRPTFQAIVKRLQFALDAYDADAALRAMAAQSVASVATSALQPRGVMISGV